METSILGCPQPLTGQIHNQEMSPAKNKTNQNKKKEEKEKKRKKGTKQHYAPPGNAQKDTVTTE